MKAVRYHSYGDSDALVYEEADRPVAGPGQVVVQVAGTSFNPVDAAIRAGFLQQVCTAATVALSVSGAGISVMAAAWHAGRQGADLLPLMLLAFS